MQRTCNEKFFVFQQPISDFGLTLEILKAGVNFAYEILDSIDATLLEAGGNRLAELVELANLSAIIGNLIRGGIVKASKGQFEANIPHTYPDLLGRGPGCKDIEIKVALETNKPKGHLVKPGPHITVRYVLGDDKGNYKRGREHRGNVAWIWEVRVGSLREEHFNFSSTEGDSGKTAVINAEGMKALSMVYCDLDRCPLSTNGCSLKDIKTIFEQRRS